MRFPDAFPLPTFASRSVLAGLVALAALATVGPLAGVPVPGSPAAGRTLEPLAQEGPLTGGAWRTYANGDRVNRILKDGETLWSATEGGGLVRWDLGTDTSTQYLYPQDGLASNTINDLELMPDGTLYLATEAALTRFDPETGRFTNLTPDTSTSEPPMPARVVRALEQRPDGTLWVGFGQEWDPELQHPRAEEPGAFRPGGLALFDPATGAWSREIHAVVVGEAYQTVVSENITDIEYGTDGLLWIGGEPFYVFEEDTNCGQEGVVCIDSWVLAGGGVAGTDLDAAEDGSFVPDKALGDAEWVIYSPADRFGGQAKATACLSNHVTQLHADIEGRMWVASLDRGLLLIQHGLRKTACSSTGLPFYTRVSTGGKPETRVDGLRGRNVFAIDIDALGRVWIAHGDGRDEGEGIAILDHHNTFHDSSANEEPWAPPPFDDTWEFITFDGLQAGSTDAVITALLVEGDGAAAYMGTKSYKYGDGYGLRRLVREDGAWTRWTPLTTAASGLPSNHLTDVRVDPATGDTWFATQRRGVARMTAAGEWRTWHAFGQGPKVATALETTSHGFSQLVTDIASLEAYNAIFQNAINYIRIGDDPTRYRARRFRPAQAGRGPWIEFFPELTRDVAAGTPIYLMDRGPASDHASQIAFADGRTFVGGRESIYLPQNECPAPPECWLDGGLGGYEEGAGWSVWSQNSSDPPDGMGVTDQEVGTVEADLTGKVWVGTGRQSRSEGDGISVYDPATNRFTYHTIPKLGSGGAKYAGNGIADLSVDPETNDMWVAHFPARRINEALDGTLSEVIHGGGVSRYDADTAEWSFWRKDAGALLRGYGNGTFNVVLADRANGRAWVGGWDALHKRFHWGEGRGVNAALNWCPIDACTKESWQSQVWDAEGEVNALSLDARGRLWVGTGRRGLAMLPPAGGTDVWSGPTRAGLRIWDGTEWYAYAPENVPLAGREIQAIRDGGESMWLATRANGLSRYWFVAPPTPTPTVTDLPPSTPTPTRTPDPIEPTPTSVVPTTPGTVVASATPTRRPTRTPGPSLACYAPRYPGWCEVFLPSNTTNAAWCRRRPCVAATPLPTFVRVTPTEAPPTPTAPPATLAPATQTPTDAPSPTEPAPSSPTPGPATASATPGGATPTATTQTAAPPPTATPTPGTSPSATSTPSPTASASATPSAGASPSPTAVRIGTWTNFNRTLSITTQDLYGVHGVTLDQVILAGASSTVLVWDGAQMTSATVPPGRLLRDVSMADARNGFIAGDASGLSGTLLRTRNGGQSWSAVTTNLVDDWIAVSLTPRGTKGWVLGGGRGVRLHYDGTSWGTQTTGDANNAAHEYSDVAMASETLAFAAQSGAAGARMFRWDGAQWTADEVTGGLFGMDVRSPTAGIAVGDAGNTWRLNASSEWERFPDKPRTASRDLYAVAMVSPDLIWAVGERGALWVWNGTEWRQELIAGVNVNLNAIWIDPTGTTGFAVGERGTILRYEATP